MEVWCGMIMGFDNDDEGIFDRQIEFIQDARIAVLDERHALGDPQDAAARPARRRGPARPGRHLRIRHQRRPAPDEPRGAARRAISACSTSSTIPKPTSSGPRPCSSSRRSTSASRRSDTGCRTRFCTSGAALLLQGHRPVHPADDPGPRRRPPRASTASGSGGS